MLFYLARAISRRGRRAGRMFATTDPQVFRPTDFRGTQGKVLWALLAVVMALMFTMDGYVQPWRAIGGIAEATITAGIIIWITGVAITNWRHRHPRKP